MIKNLIILGLIVVVGALTYSSWRPYIDSSMKKDEVVAPVATTTPEIVVNETPVVEVAPKPVVAKPPVVIDEDGALRDGPFVIRDKDGKDTGATAEIIRSPEETLLQFKDVSFKHGGEAQIYFASDKKATKHINLGPAHLNSGTLIYGMPLDANLSIYKYILIYNPQTNITEFYAEM